MADKQCLMLYVLFPDMHKFFFNSISSDKHFKKSLHLVRKFSSRGYHRVVNSCVSMDVLAVVHNGVATVEMEHW